MTEAKPKIETTPKAESKRCPKCGRKSLMPMGEPFRTIPNQQTGGSISLTRGECKARNCGQLSVIRQAV